MAKFNTGQSFADGDQVTGAKLNNIIGLLDIYSGVIADQASIAATVSTADLLLIADTDAGSSGAANKVTIQKLLNDTLTGGTFTNANIAEQLTYGTATGNRTISTSAVITNGTISNATLGTTTGTLATITNLTAGTTTSTSANITNGTVQTLTASTATITGGTYSGAINSTTGTIGTLNSTTPTFLGAITASTNTINVGSGQIYKDASGNVGIGTASPRSPLDVNGNTYVAGGSQIQITGSPGTTGLQLFGQDAAESLIGTMGSQALAFRTNATERLRIDSSGNVGIGTNSPSGTLHSVSTSASVTPGIFAITATSSTATPAVAVIKQDALNTTNQNFVLFQVGGGTSCGKINANGANTAAFGSTSDSRLKENITALPSQIDNICALKPCEFDYKDGSGHQIGFIAQEMQQIYPDSVGVGDDGMLTITAWSKTEARLVKAIQELKSKNDSLEARLEALEDK